MKAAVYCKAHRLVERYGSRARLEAALAGLSEPRRYAWWREIGLAIDDIQARTSQTRH